LITPTQDFVIFFSCKMPNHMLTDFNSPISI
jgi:hypothetical protein